MRYEDLPFSHRSQRRFARCFAIFPGPKEPTNMDSYMSLLLEELKVGECNVTVKVNVNGQITQQTMAHSFLLSGVYADTPAGKKLTKHAGQSSYLGCGHCWCMGVYAEGSMRFPPKLRYGRFKKGEREGLLPDYSKPCTVGDDCTKLSHVMHVHRGEVMDMGTRKFEDLGCHGTTPFLKACPYIDYNNTLLIPMAHAAQGVIKDFISILTDTKDMVIDKKVIASRARHFIPTCDIGKPYMCIWNERGFYTMEDHFNFLEFWSLCIFHDVINAGLAHMWSLLRKGLLYFIRSNHVTCVA